MSYELATAYKDNPDVRISAYTFGSPRVGNAPFARDYDDLVHDSWRLYNSKDVIATVPRLLKYSHVKTGVMIDSSNDLIKLGAASRQDQGCEGNDYDHVELVADHLLDLNKNTNDKNNNVEITSAVNELLPSLNRMIEKEMEMLSMLQDGSAIMDHMEDLYFYALQRVLIKEITGGKKI